MPYKLSSALRGHELDVRAVSNSVFPEGSILSASRDRTTRLWTSQDGGQTYNEGHVFTGHKNFVSAVCALPPTDQYPHGLVATGGHDNVILVWKFDSIEPVYCLTGHSGAVCSLVAGKFGTLLSGSWDNTAKVWLGGKCVMTLEGHEGSIWAVLLMPDHGLMLTGSADKSIKLWKAGSCQSTFTGHTDCIRGLAVISAVEFISCSNDCTIRRWMTTGECLQVYTGHTNFIYSVSALSDNGGFASVGEDRSLRIWTGDASPQIITLPAQSVWCVICLPNGDIVTGSSDGVVRIFTCQEERFASSDEIKLFEDEVASQAIPAQASGAIGDIKLEELPGPEALLRPGNKSGQTIMVRRGQTVECHQWNDMEGKWDKIGEVVGAAGSEGTSRNANKTMYKGKEYDYVFSVEIQEGKPPLKLPYNLNEDPWVAAHNFLENNELSQMFLDQVVSFIQKNTEGLTIGQQGPDVSDPFTGGSRYVPGSSSHSSLDNQPSTGGGAVDPFTGGGSYRPTYGPTTTHSGLGGAADPFTGGSSYRPAEQATTKASTTSSHFFPKADMVTFSNANTNAICSKINETNDKLALDVKLSPEELQHLIDVLTMAASLKGQSLSDKQLIAISKALQWPTSVLFPVLDVVRLLVRHPAVAVHLCTSDIMEQLLQISRYGGVVVNALLSFRIFANMFTSSEGLSLMLKYREKVVEQLSSWIPSNNKNIHISLCTVFLNYSVMYRQEPDFEGQTQCLSTLSTVLENISDNEARFRALVAVGNIVYGNVDSISYGQTLGLDTALQSLTTVHEPAKVGECASKVLQVLTAAS